MPVSMEAHRELSSLAHCISGIPPPKEPIPIRIWGRSSRYSSLPRRERTFLYESPSRLLRRPFVVRRPAHADDVAHHDVLLGPDEPAYLVQEERLRYLHRPDEAEQVVPADHALRHGGPVAAYADDMALLAKLDYRIECNRTGGDFQGMVAIEGVDFHVNSIQLQGIESGNGDILTKMVNSRICRHLQHIEAFRLGIQKQCGQVDG